MTVTTTVLPWRNASELAFVRDCFYPHHALSSAAANDDVYSVTVAGDLDPDASVDASASVQTEVQRCRLGLKRVEIWNFRSPRGVPHAVVATAALVEARMYDGMSSGLVSTGTVLGSSTLKHSGATTRGRESDDAGRGTGVGIVLTESALKSIYAMAFLRFVNGFVDRDVSRAFYRTGLSKVNTSEPELFDDDASVGNVKSVGENSMYAFAASIGMPSGFVDLRHRCVHGSVLPELSMLRRTSERALEWLWERWWKGNVIGDSGRWLWERGVEREKRARMGRAHEMEESERMEDAVVEHPEGIE